MKAHQQIIDAHQVEAVAGAGRFNYLYGDADKCFDYGGRNMCIHTVGQLYGSSCNAQACSVWLGYCEPSDCNSDAPATTDAPPANNGGDNGGSGDSPADSGSMGSHDMSCGTSKFPVSILGRGVRCRAALRWDTFLFCWVTA